MTGQIERSQEVVGRCWGTVQIQRRSKGFGKDVLSHWQSCRLSLGVLCMAKTYVLPCS